MELLLKLTKLAALDERAQFGDHYAVALTADGELVGVAGVELYGDVGLLRSVAVGESWRSRGLGRKLTEDRLRWARERGVRELFLLTVDAQSYWERYGFVRMERSEAPESISATSQWAGGCSATATAMRKRLEA